MEPYHYRRLLRVPPKPDYEYQSSNVGRIFSAIVGTFILLCIFYIVLQCIRRWSQLNSNAAAISQTKQDPACMAQLQTMPVMVYVGGAELGMCPVCLAEYVKGEEVRTLLPCKHVFHRACVDHWLMTRSSFCPVCRNRVIQRKVEPKMNSCNNSSNINSIGRMEPSRMQLQRAFGMMVPGHCSMVL